MESSINLTVAFEQYLIDNGLYEPEDEQEFPDEEPVDDFDDFNAPWSPHHW